MLFHLFLHLVRQGGRGGVLLLGVGKAAHALKLHVLGELRQLGEVLLCLPGKPVMKVVRSTTPGTFSRMRSISAVRLCLSPRRFMARSTFPEACCKGRSM